MYGKYSYLFDEKNIVLKIKEFKKDVNFFQSRNKNRLLSAEIANLYHRLSLAKNIMDNIIINNYLPTIVDEKGIIDRINLYNRYIFDNDLTDVEYHQVKRDMENYSYCFKYNRGYRISKRKRFFI